MTLGPPCGTARAEAEQGPTDTCSSPLSLLAVVTKGKFLLI